MSTALIEEPVSGRQISYAWTDERLARLGISHCVLPGSLDVAGMIREVGAEETWQRLRGGSASPRPGLSWRVFELNPEQLAVDVDASGFRFIIPGDVEWPESLASLEGCELDGLGGVPVGLWAKGPKRLNELCERALAIVGSRASTRYGEIVATELAYDLSRDDSGVTVVSGGADGIDASAHRGALSADGATIGVYAQGLDTPYPRGLSTLCERLGEDQLIISESASGYAPSKSTFLARNRLIAALGQGTIIVEAAERSGAANTAAWTRALGRDLAAVPGPVTSATSVTPNRLIRDRLAHLVSSSEDVMFMMPQFAPPMDAAPDLAPEHIPLLRVMRERPVSRRSSVGELALMSGIDVQQCSTALEQLYLQSLVVGDHGTWQITPKGAMALKNTQPPEVSALLAHAASRLADVNKLGLHTNRAADTCVGSPRPLGNGNRSTPSL